MMATPSKQQSRRHLSGRLPVRQPHANASRPPTDHEHPGFYQHPEATVARELKTRVLALALRLICSTPLIK
jgi:hypothetical protein